jgi:hypothetical protein
VRAALGGFPEVILMENWKNMRNYTGGNQVDCLKAFMLCDYMKDSRNNMVYYNDLLVRNDVDVAICSTPEVQRLAEGEIAKDRLPPKLDTVWIPHGVETNIFMKRDLPKKYDVMCVYGLVSYVYPNRPNVQELIKKMNVTSLVGEWRTGIKHHAYARAINESKIFVNCNGINNQILMKYFEVMASGTLLLTNKPNDCEAYGLIPGVHFATWSNLHDLEERIYYYLMHDEEREKIANQGMEYIRSYYSAEDVASRIIDELSIRVGVKDLEVSRDEVYRITGLSGIIGE